MDKRAELLAPAGDMERLSMALAYGADAVYLSGSRFGMRAFAGNFTPQALTQAVALCREKGAAVYVTCNTLPRQAEAEELPQWLSFLNELEVNAVIVADPGVLALAKRYAPRVAVHVSTQAGVVSALSASAWHDMGASRVVLARELSLEEIAEIRAKTPPSLELEAFVHGSMCVSYSGRCLLSSYLTGRDANRGECAQPCRYRYALVEEKRPGAYYPIEEDHEGTYILNAQDLCMIDHLPDLLASGVTSLKVEGRAKSAYYVAVITGAYRHALDAALSGSNLDPVWRREVEHVSHRPYSTGFYYGPAGQYTQDSQYIRDRLVCAVVTACDGQGNATLSLRNKLTAGEELELISPNAPPMTFQVPPMTDALGMPLLEPRTPQMVFHMKLPWPVPPLSMLRRAAS